MYFSVNVVIDWEPVQGVFLHFAQNVLERLQPLL